MWIVEGKLGVSIQLSVTGHCSHSFPTRSLSRGPSCGLTHSQIRSVRGLFVNCTTLRIRILFNPFYLSGCPSVHRLLPCPTACVISLLQSVLCWALGRSPMPSSCSEPSESSLRINVTLVHATYEVLAIWQSLLSQLIIRLHHSFLVSRTFQLFFCLLWVFQHVLLLIVMLFFMLCGLTHIQEGQAYLLTCVHDELIYIRDIQSGRMLHVFALVYSPESSVW